MPSGWAATRRQNPYLGLDEIAAAEKRAAKEKNAARLKRQRKRLKRGPSITRAGKLNPRGTGAAIRMDIRWPTDLLKAIVKTAEDEQRTPVDFIRTQMRLVMEERGVLAKRRGAPPKRLIVKSELEELDANLQSLISRKAKEDGKRKNEANPPPADAGAEDSATA